MNKTRISRRNLLLAAALAPTAFSFSARAAQRTGPRIALIGCGRQGMEVLARAGRHVDVVCDVDARRREAALEQAVHARACADYREVLERRDIDGVVIATPDHWHAEQACRAMEAGKDVFLETPVCLSLHDARWLVKTAERFRAVVQVGKAAHWTRAEGEPVALEGPLGSRDGVSVSCYGDDNAWGGDVMLNGPAPEGLDWDRWLGSARWRPYNPGLLDGRFRHVLGLGGGELATQGSEVFYAVLDALALEDLGTVRVSARGTSPLDGLYDAPLALRVTYSLPDQGARLVWQQRKLAAEESRFGARLREGETVTELRPLFGVRPAEGEPPRDILAEALGYWLDAMVLRPDTGPELRRAADAAVLAALGTIAWRLGREVTWNNRAGAFVDDPAADRLIAPPARAL